MNKVVCIERISNGFIVIINGDEKLFECKDDVIEYLNDVFELTGEDRMTKLPDTVYQIESLDAAFKVMYGGIRFLKTLRDI